MVCLYLHLDNPGYQTRPSLWVSEVCLPIVEKGLKFVSFTHAATLIYETYHTSRN